MDLEELQLEMESIMAPNLEDLNFDLEEMLENMEIDLNQDVLRLEWDALEMERWAEQWYEDALLLAPEVVGGASYSVGGVPVVLGSRSRFVVAGQDPDTDAIPAPRSRGRNRSRAVVSGMSSDVKASYQQAYALILDEQWEDAQAAMEVFISSNYRNRSTDDATFWYAYALEKMIGLDEKVFDAYYAFVSVYPESKWEDDAKANLSRLGRTLVKTDRKNRGKYEPIMEALKKDDDLKVAVAALYGLRRIGDEKSLRAIINIYDKNDNVELRKNIVSILGRFEGDLVVAKLAEIASKDSNPEVRSVALSSLARQDEEMAVTALISIATTDPDPDIRADAVSALGRSDSEAAVHALEGVARTDAHVNVRTKAVSALGRIGTQEAQEALIRILERN